MVADGRQNCSCHRNLPSIDVQILRPDPPGNCEREVASTGCSSKALERCGISVYLRMKVGRHAIAAQSVKSAATHSKSGTVVLVVTRVPVTYAGERLEDFSRRIVSIQRKGAGKVITIRPQCDGFGDVSRTLPAPRSHCSCHWGTRWRTRESDSSSIWICLSVPRHPGRSSHPAVAVRNS